jgi:hypothetical protein
MSPINYILFTLFSQYSKILAENNSSNQANRAQRILMLCHRLCKNHPKFAPVWEMFIVGAGMIGRGDTRSIALVDISLQIMNMQQCVKEYFEKEEWNA